MSSGLKGAFPAPDFPAGLDWIHTGGQALAWADPSAGSGQALRGKLVLLDFWTYG